MTGIAETLDQREEVREVAARLLTATAKAGGPGVFLFTSVREGHGTSTIAAAVARALAGSGRRTVLASVASPGRSAAADGWMSLREVVEDEREPTFSESSLIRVSVPGSLLDILETARDPRSWLKTFDILILDAPGFAEFLTRFWIPQAHGVVLVVDGEKASLRSLLLVRDEIHRLGGTLLGVALNRHRSRIPRLIERFLNG